MKKALLTVLTAVGVFAAGAVAHAETLSGQVQSVDTAGNSLILQGIAGPQGKESQYKIVWDEKIQGGEALENAQVGEEVTVDAKQNFFTRNWKVKEIASAAALDANAAGEAEADQAVTQTSEADLGASQAAQPAEALESDIQKGAADLNASASEAAVNMNNSANADVQTDASAQPAAGADQRY